MVSRDANQQSQNRLENRKKQENRATNVSIARQPQQRCLKFTKDGLMDSNLSHRRQSRWRRSCPGKRRRLFLPIISPIRIHMMTIPWNGIFLWKAMTSQSRRDMDSLIRQQAAANVSTRESRFVSQDGERRTSSAVCLGREPGWGCPILP